MWDPSIEIFSDMKLLLSVFSFSWPLDGLALRKLLSMTVTWLVALFYEPLIFLSLNFLLDGFEMGCLS